MNQPKMTLFSSSTLAAFVLGATVLSGCGVANPGQPNPTGGINSTGSGTAASGGGAKGGEDYFVANVFPKLSVCAGCHVAGAQGAPKFLGADGKSSYDLIKARPELYTAQSGILLKGAHLGPALTADQKSAVQEWLKLEFNGASTEITGPPPPNNTDLTMAKLIQEFTSCMDPDVWKDSGMDGWSLLQTEGFGPCAGCHQQGNAGTWIQQDPDDTFNNSKAEPYVYRYVIAHFSEAGILDGLEGSKRLIDKGNSVIQFDPKDVTYRHPTYFVPQNLATALSSFQNTTLGKMGNLSTNVCTDPH